MQLLYESDFAKYYANHFFQRVKAVYGFFSLGQFIHFLYINMCKNLAFLVVKKIMKLERKIHEIWTGGGG